MKSAVKQFKNPSANTITLFGLWTLGIFGGKIEAIRRKTQNVATVMDYRFWLSEEFGSELNQRVKREQVWKFLLETLDGKSILVLEFGVAWGYSTNWWSRRLGTNTEFQWHGFDRFTGLPSDWRFLSKGHFDAGGQVPNIIDERIHFHKGDIEVTLPEFKLNRQEEQVLVLFFDFDLFEPSQFAWNAMKEHLKVGDILYFDEAFDADERKLLDEVVLKDESLRIEYLASSAQCLLVRVINV